MTVKNPVASLLLPLLILSLSCASGTQFLYGTPTPTVTITPSQTARPTSTIAPSRTPRPDYSKAMILLSDLPDDFEDISDAFPGDITGYKSLTNYAYGNARLGQFIVGNTVALNNSGDQFSFKMFASNPELAAELIIGEAENVVISDTFTMEDVGESCLGFRGVMKVNGISFNVEFAILQRDSLGAFIANFYVPPNRPDVKIEDLMRILDGHFIEVLSNGPST
jgi:hypothetical protein